MPSEERMSSSGVIEFEENYGFRIQLDEACDQNKLKIHPVRCPGSVLARLSPLYLLTFSARHSPQVAPNSENAKV